MMAFGGGAPQRRGGGRQPMSPYEGAAAEAGGMPVGETGVPSRTMPAEMGGGFPPGSMNATIPMFPGEV